MYVHIKFNLNCTGMFACWTVFSFTVEPIYGEAGGQGEEAMMGIYHEPDRELKIESDSITMSHQSPSSQCIETS